MALSSRFCAFAFAFVVPLALTPPGVLTVYRVFLPFFLRIETGISHPFQAEKVFLLFLQGLSLRVKNPAPLS
jgi:hypothetical protein